jgi:eukaryotic-like serine/threonine-protein kinase
VSDDTVPEFGRPARDAGGQAHAAGEPRRTSCPTCGSRFSPDGRFCPFDGTPLVPESGADPSQDPLVGRVLDGRYEVLSVLGEGGMGTVYEVRHRMLGKRFALKALRRELALDQDIAARFIQEARTAAAISHPGLVEITDFGQLDSGQVYFVMELLSGCSLAALLRRGGPMPATRALSIVRQLVGALKAAHEASIVHRDLKPDNIHVASDDAGNDVVKIVDFGLAKVIGSSRLTRAGMVFGTPHYMSPEQAAGEAVDHRADIYSLGIVMYEMFTGKVPFEADSYMGVLTKHMYMAPAPPSELSPELKSVGALEEVILRCLQKRPAARYPDVGALWADLQQRLPSGAGMRPSAAPSLLADQVELPSRGESPAHPAETPWRALAFGLTFVTFVAAAATAAALWSREGVGAAPPPGTSAHPAPAVRLAPSLAPSLRAITPVPVSTTSSSAAPPSAVTAQASALVAPSRKPVRAEPKPAVSPQGRAGAHSSRRLGGGEIVDPWAN